jgi:tRNA(Ile)-lysidine synthetase-like protein
VSGGADSTALLLGLHRLRAELGLELRAAHLHHGLRGRQADRDLAFVRALCARLRVPLVSARRDTRVLMRRRGLSGQAGLRRLRREFLLGAARRAGAAAIATAHTADDQLETLLLRLGRGTGLRGLGAMSARHGPWIRPLLGASREQIEADLRRAGQAWREDRSNAEPRYLRSRIRHQAIPALVAALGDEWRSVGFGRRATRASRRHPAATAGGPTAAARGALARRVAAILAEVRAARRMVERRAARLLARSERAVSRQPPGEAPSRAARRRRRGEPSSRDRRPEKAALTLDRRLLAARSPLLQRTALRRAARRLDLGSGLTDGHLRGLVQLLASGRDGTVNLPGGMVAVVGGGRLRIGPPPRGIEGPRVRQLPSDPPSRRAPGRNPS